MLSIAAPASGMNSAFMQSCYARLKAHALSAETLNAEVSAVFIRSKAYADFKKAPSDFWMLSQRDPKTFLLSVTDRIEMIGDYTERYAQLMMELDPQKITPEQAKEIVALESDPLFNMLLDETEAMPEFESENFPNLSSKAQKTYLHATGELKKFLPSVLELRKKLKTFINPGSLSLQSAKLLLNNWVEAKDIAEIHPDILPDWITGADAALHSENNYVDPSSGHQTGYGATPLKVVQDSLADLPLEKGDTVFDIGSGWGRVVAAGALLHPEYNFKGIEYISERAAHVQTQIQKLGISNAKSFQGDASAKEIEADVENSKALFLFNSFSEPALELFLSRVQNVVKRSGKTKYIVTVNEQLFPFKLSSRGFKVYRSQNSHERGFSRYTIYEIKP